MAVDEDELLRWVALHEVTHALQFAGVPWLREHLGGLLRSLIGSLEVALDPSRLLRLPSARRPARPGATRSPPASCCTFVAGPEQRRCSTACSATMAVLEGHAEHVMDAVGARRCCPRCRACARPMTRRRASAVTRSRGCSRACWAWR